jgi:penicillin-binding protein 2
MGIRRMDTILTQFGFGALTGIDLDEELPGIVASPEWKRKAKGAHWYLGDTVISAIGQGSMQATPLQLASAVATLASHGKRFTPHLLLGDQIPGSPYQTQQPLPLPPVTLKDENYWNMVISAMQNVVNAPNGSARRYGRNLPYTIAAKTGTGQIISRRKAEEQDNIQSNLPEKLRDHHSFIAFAPVDKPKIAIAIITENSNFAIETARTLFDYYLGNQQHVNRQSQTQTKKTGA